VRSEEGEVRSKEEEVRRERLTYWTGLVRR
jgi:hypothetical protein